MPLAKPDKLLYIPTMVAKAKKPREDYMLQIYIGFGAMGQAKDERIRKKAKSLGIGLSKMILDALREKYPTLGI